MLQMDGGDKQVYDEQMAQQQQMAEMYQQQQMQQQMMPQHDWMELDDHYKMVDENQIEPDYYIDRPVSIPYLSSQFLLLALCTLHSR